MAARNNTLLAFTACLLVLCIVAVFLRALQVGPAAPASALELPQVMGWTHTDIPVADTPEMKRAVAEMLNFDWARQRVYVNGGVAITVFIAHWSAGSFHPRLVAIHTPDVCWVGAGWRMKKLGDDFIVERNSYESWWPAAHRHFEINGTEQYVSYWHLVGGVPGNYLSASTSRGFFDSFKAVIVSGVPAQYFIRLSSNVPLEQSFAAPGVENLLNALDPLLLKGGRNAPNGLQ